MKRCLYCYLPIEHAHNEYHPSCAKKLFGTTIAPVLDIDLKQLEELAKQIVIQSKALTGVQAKLSLHVEKQKNEPSRFS